MACLEQDLLFIENAPETKNLNFNSNEVSPSVKSELSSSFRK